MSIIVVLIPLGLLLVGLAVWAFIWAVNHEQFEDLDRAAHSILFDDDEPESDGTAESPPDAGAGPRR
jgi:cbb3-type cytochrome oxidase maturation protein